MVHRGSNFQKISISPLCSKRSKTKKKILCENFCDELYSFSALVRIRFLGPIFSKTGGQNFFKFCQKLCKLPGYSPVKNKKNSDCTNFFIHKKPKSNFGQFEKFFQQKTPNGFSTKPELKNRKTYDCRSERDKCVSVFKFEIGRFLRVLRIGARVTHGG